MTTLIRKSLLNNSLLNNSLTHKGYLLSQRLLTTKTLQLNNTTENVYIKDENSDNMFINSLKKSRINSIGVVGWGSQGQAQAQNLRDTINRLNLNIPVIIGLRQHSKSAFKAMELGFEVNNIEDVLSSCDLNLMLISDYAQSTDYEHYFSYLKPNSTLGFSHGFLLGHLKNIGSDFPVNNNIIMVAPKGMGITVRDKYVNGSGINSSFAVYRDVDFNADNLALAWAYGIGSPQIFETTMEKEYVSDIFGERCILLGGLHGIVEYLCREFDGLYTCDAAYNYSVNYIINELSDEIYKNGFLKIYASFNDFEKKIFDLNYSKSYNIARVLYEEIYDEVESGNEIRSVLLNSNREFSNISGSKMWKINKDNKYVKIYDDTIKAIVSGFYIGNMMAQIDILIEKDHSYSEIVNESIIEAVYSLNPFMAKHGISYMIDNCSTTARLGARKWAPRLDYLYNQNYYNEVESKKKHFLNHEIHKVYKKIRNI
jgi:ketol-acid reductoisomerase